MVARDHDEPPCPSTLACGGADASGLHRALAISMGGSHPTWSTETTKPNSNAHPFAFHMKVRNKHPPKLCEPGWLGRAMQSCLPGPTKRAFSDQAALASPCHSAGAMSSRPRRLGQPCPSRKDSCWLIWPGLLPWEQIGIWWGKLEGQVGSACLRQASPCGVDRPARSLREWRG